MGGDGEGDQTNMGAQIEAEAKLRGHAEGSPCSCGTRRPAHAERLRVLGEFQQTAIDHSRRCGGWTRVTSMRTSAEQRLAEEALKVQQIGDGQKQRASSRLAAGGGGGGGASSSSSAAAGGAHGLGWRSWRRRCCRSATPSAARRAARAAARGERRGRGRGRRRADAVESVVLQALDASGHSVIMSLDEKVKEASCAWAPS